MSTATVRSLPTPAPGQVPMRYSRWRLTLGLLGRAWLWFLAGSLLVTVVPLLFGWRPYLIETGSMSPRIAVGDIVLSAPTDLPDEDLVGHVIVFRDTDSGHMTTHRAVGLDDSGGLVTKGDANPTNDPRPVAREDVHGLGRLLVQFVGLPLVWAHQGAWLLVVLFAASIAAAGWAVSRDHEDDPLEPGEPPDGQVQNLPTGAGDPPAATIAATKPGPHLRQARPVVWLRLPRLALVPGVAMVLALTGPTAYAAFGVTTASNANSWAVPNVSYTTEVNALGPYLYWKLDDTTGTTAVDASGNGRPGTYSPNAAAANFTRGITGGLVTDTPNSAVTLNSASSCLNTTSTTSITAPQVFTVIAWFRAPASYTAGGKLVGFEKPRTGVAAPSTGTYDRHLYMDGNGLVWFGVYNNADVGLNSGTSLKNDAWHMAVGTMSSAGMRLYIDGQLVASNANTVAENVTGWWRAGCGNLGGWGNEWTGSNNPGTDAATTANRPFRASLDEITVFTTALTPAQVSLLYWAR